MGQLCPLAWLASESDVIPGLPNSARRRGARHGARATASPEDSYRMHLRTGAVLGEFWESQGEQHTE